MIAAVVQMNSQDDVAKNLARASELVRAAAGAGAKLVVLPENFAFMGEEAKKREIAERLEGGARGPILDALAHVANECDVHVVGGGMPEKSNDMARPWNTSVLVAPSGAIA